MFDLPPLSPGIDPTLPADKKQLAEWLKQGEGRDISATIRRVYDTLKGLNRAELNDKNRFAMLELLADPIADISSTLKRHYSGLDQPLPPPNRKIALSLGRLLRQYTIGYQRLVMAASGQGNRFDPSGLHAIAHHRVIVLSAKALMVYYRAYLAPPGGIWLDMHRTYQQAQKLSIGQITGGPNGQQQNLEQAYLTALLCDLADPYRLTAGDIDRVRDYVRDHLQLCLVGSGSQAQKKPGLFIVHFAIDVGAQEVGDIILRSERDGFLLDTSKLVKTIHQQLTDLGHKATPAGQWLEQKKHIAMLRCLVVAFALRPNRQQERSAADGELWVIRGLKTVHLHIASHSTDESSLPEIELEDSLESPAIPMPSTGNDMHHWDLLDQSPGGFALLREATGHARVAIGDLLAFANSPEGPWQTGVVKRVRYRGEEDLIVGVQRLSGKAQAVSVVAAEEAGDKQPALLHRGEINDGVQATLLLPLGHWQSGDSVRLEKLGKLQLGHIVELTAQFELFEVTAL